jgi:hypothetical protein
MEQVQERRWHYEQIGKPKQCPKCDAAKMMNVEFSSMVMTSNPPQQRWYWECEGCGYQELGGIHVHEPIKSRVAI